MPIPRLRLSKSRHVLFGAVSVLVFLLALYASHQGRELLEAGSTSEKPGGRPRVLLEPRPVTLVPGIHLLGGLSPAAAYVVETNAGLVLIDSGLEPDAQSVMKQMRFLGLDWRQVRAILLTHAHGDHSGGAARLRTVTGCKIYAGEADAEVLRTAGPREAIYSKFRVPESIHPEPTPVDVALSGGERIEFGDVCFHVFAAPGHTPGSICYLAECDGKRFLFAGDVILSLGGYGDASTPAARLGTYAAFLPPRYRGDARAFLATLRSLRRLPVPDLVLPGHPRNDAVPQDAAMSSSEWESMLEAGIHDMERLVGR